jgi:TRAP-type mannitol/chloroaromatic compound transport system substrate-binding protein
MMWQQWLLGDYVQNIPPLKILTSADVAHLDALPWLSAKDGDRLGRFSQIFDM